MSVPVGPSRLFKPKPLAGSLLVALMLLSVFLADRPEEHASLFGSISIQKVGSSERGYSLDNEKSIFFGEGERARK